MSWETLAVVACVATALIIVLVVVIARAVRRDTSRVKRLNGSSQHCIHYRRNSSQPVTPRRGSGASQVQPLGVDEAQVEIRSAAFASSTAAVPKRKRSRRSRNRDSEYDVELLQLPQEEHAGFPQYPTHSPRNTLGAWRFG